jgi:hypothetical protein
LAATDGRIAAGYSWDTAATATIRGPERAISDNERCNVIAERGG